MRSNSGNFRRHNGGRNGNFMINSCKQNDNWNESAKSGNKSAKTSRDSGKRNGAIENACRRSARKKKKSERNEKSRGWKD
jgi:hypothetical protein